MKKYIIDFDVFEAAMIFAGTNDIRYYLNGVRLCKNRIESTNGNIGYMAKMRDSFSAPKGVDGCAILPDVIIRPKNKLPAKTRKNLISYCSITLGDTPRIDYLSFYGEIVWSDILEVIDGKFPNLAKIFAEHKKQEKVDEFFGVNAGYLALIDKALKREKFKTVIFHPKSSDKSILVEFDRIHVEAKEQALLMPLRIDRE